MTAVNYQHLIIPYGVSRWDKTIFSASAGTDESLTVECHTRFMVIDPLEAIPLRLNGVNYEFHEPPNMRLLPTVWEQLAFLETHFFALCSHYAKYQRLFISRYFGFIHDRIEAEQAVLRKAIEDFGNLYEYADWAFSALRPLPQAYVFAPVEKSDEAIPNADDFVAVDMVFWTGENLLALDLSDPNTTDPFQLRRLDRVKNAGIEILKVTPEVLENDDPNALRAVLPEIFHHFWRGELAPSRPFVDTKLGNITASEIDF